MAIVISEEFLTSIKGKRKQNFREVGGGNLGD